MHTKRHTQTQTHTSTHSLTHTCTHTHKQTNTHTQITNNKTTTNTNITRTNQIKQQYYNKPGLTYINIVRVIFRAIQEFLVVADNNFQNVWGKFEISSQRREVLFGFCQIDQLPDDESDFTWWGNWRIGKSVNLQIKGNASYCFLGQLRNWYRGVFFGGEGRGGGRGVTSIYSSEAGVYWNTKKKPFRFFFVI